MVEPTGTLGAPAITAYALNGQPFSSLAPHRRLNIIWDQLKLVDNRADFGAVDEFPQRTD